MIIKKKKVTFSSYKSFKLLPAEKDDLKRDCNCSEEEDSCD